MKTRLVRIGNSHGVRLPRAFIAQAALADEVNLELREGAIVISRPATGRAGWAAAARRQHGAGEDEPVGGEAPNRFDMTECTW